MWWAVRFRVAPAPATGDARYAALPPEERELANIDRSGVGSLLQASARASRPTTEAGGRARVYVLLSAAPLAGEYVRVALATSRPAEGVVVEPAAGRLVFGASNWSDPALVRLQGVDDDVDDGDQLYALILTATLPGGGVVTASVGATNADDDTASIAVTAPPPPVAVTELGTSIGVGVRLTSRPAVAPVVVHVASEDTGEIAVAGGGAALSFSGSNTGRAADGAPGRCGRRRARR